ncbi:MAG: reverse transcriptase domain-containing protein [Candidatus Thiodiazotropha endolucinida]|nr:hypothetical protein [Candidatus Thiodiazotropha taylori]MCW4262726.1 reverse transcriptase domain-containing protein [Candidatus Thiodiazotropha endolucinida]
MSIDLNVYRARIGLHRYRLLRLKGLKRFNSFEFFVFLAMFLHLSGDVEKNPGPESDTSSETSTPVFPIFEGNFSVVHYNVQSLFNKVNIVEPELADFDVISLTETWLNETIMNEDITFNNFQPPFRRDRIGDSHGGIAVYVKNGIPCKRRGDLELIDIECMWLEINVRNRKILVGTFYRPPNSTPFVLNEIENSIGLAVDTGTADIVVVGDFNLNVLNTQSERKIADLCQQYNFNQLINEPTNYTEYSSTIIDLIMVSNMHSVNHSGVGEPFLMQDIRYHCPTFCIFNFKKYNPKSFNRKIWLYDRGNYAELCQKVSDFDWNSIRNDDVNIYAESFTDNLLALAEQSIPCKTVTIRPRDLPWINSDIRKTMRKRNRLFRKYKHDHRIDTYSRFKQTRNEVIKLIRKSKQNYITSLANKLKTGNLSVQDYWKTLKTFIKPTQTSSIPPLLKDNVFISEDSEKANLLNSYFVEQTLIDDQSATLPCSINRDIPTLNTVQITPKQVEDTLKSLKLGKASGPDNVNNRILKELAEPLSNPLCDLFNYSLAKCVFPDKWKEANVSPLFKKDDPSLISNYRPISLLSTIGKVMEKIVHKHLFNYFKEHSLITCLQSGFSPGDSTVNQLVDIYNTFCKALDDGKEVRAIFCDISKAFDRVWHRGLLHKLEKVGIKSTLLHWLASYLSNRKQRVVLPGGISDWLNIHAGVPQGSILGPLLFLIYINDIVDNIDSSVRLFADDTTLYLIVDDPHVVARQLNSDLEKIHVWAERWLVKFNPAKSESLLLSRKKNRPLHPPLLMNNEPIQEVSSHKHLGIYLSSDGTWHEHIDYITSKAWTRINVMRKFKFTLDRQALEKIYVSFIRPLLEYADVVWDNCTRYEVIALEKIQIEAARIVTGATKLVSLEMLYRDTGWETLENRRRNHKLFLFYKMTNDITPAYLSALIPPLVENTTTYDLRNATNIRQTMCRTQLYYNSFLPSCIRAWNELSPDVRDVNSLAIFKHRMNENTMKPPKYYFIGERFSQIHHTRLRTSCSSLNHHLFLKNIVNDPNCTCGAIETSKHYLFECQRYNGIRIDMMTKVTVYCQPTTNTLLFGDTELSYNQNCEIFLAVQKFITDSKRFKT